MIINPVSKEWLSGVLTGLGSTADEVATILRAAGITGERSNGVRCPIAVYVRAKAKERALSASRVGVWTGANTVSVWIRAHNGEESVSVELPQAVIDFIEAFDSGSGYGDLADGTQA